MEMLGAQRASTAHKVRSCSGVLTDLRTAAPTQTRDMCNPVPSIGAGPSIVCQMQAWTSVNTLDAVEGHLLCSKQAQNIMPLSI